MTFLVPQVAGDGPYEPTNKTGHTTSTSWIMPSHSRKSYSTHQDRDPERATVRKDREVIRGTVTAAKALRAAASHQQPRPQHELPNRKHVVKCFTDAGRLKTTPGVTWQDTLNSVPGLGGALRRRKWRTPIQKIVESLANEVSHSPFEEVEIRTDGAESTTGTPITNLITRNARDGHGHMVEQDANNFQAASTKCVKSLNNNIVQ